MARAKQYYIKCTAHKIDSMGPRAVMISYVCGDCHELVEKVWIETQEIDKRHFVLRGCPKCGKCNKIKFD